MDSVEWRHHASAKLWVALALAVGFGLGWFIVQALGVMPASSFNLLSKTDVPVALATFALTLMHLGSMVWLHMNARELAGGEGLPRGITHRWIYTAVECVFASLLIFAVVIGPLYII